MRILQLILLFLVFTNAEAQLSFGEFNTPYSGIYGAQFNAAEIVDSRYKFHLNLLGGGIGLSNNFIAASKDLISPNPPKITDQNRPQYLIQELNGKPKHFYTQMDVQTLSGFMNFGRNNKLAIGLQTGMKLLVTANNVDERLARFMYNNKDSSTWGPSASKDFMAHVAAWTYTGITLGAVIIDNQKISLKGAVTGKINTGIAGMYMYSPNLYADLTDQNIVRDANFRMQSQFASPFLFNNQIKADSLKLFADNSGFGADVGLIFEKKDKKDYSYEFNCRTDNYRKDLNKYAWRFGVSISDFGSIKWNPNGRTIRSYSVDSSAFRFPLNLRSFEKIGEPGSFIDTLRKYQFNGVEVDTTVEPYTMATPATLNIFFDVHIYKGIYIAANGMYAFQGSTASGYSWTQNSRFTLTPRLESKKFGVYLPVQYNMLSQEINAGIGMRLFCFNLALTDWTAIAQLKSKTKNFGLTLGFHIPILQRASPKDKDGDLMGGKFDKCKDGAGDCNSGGCPEPDDDNDGVKNSMDKCPKEPGPAKLDGCPDRDEDGVPDSKDRCPKKKGPYELGGCPDKDGDGVIDDEDKCPKDKGSLELQGCPDADGDGVINDLDECPNTKGVFENNGCPKIEVIDTDKDGVEDKDDQCPKEYGSKSNKGCPVIEKEAFDIAKIAQEKLEFHTGSSAIKPESFASLLVLADYLNKNPSIKLELSGHTDNIGKPEKNLKLSNDRANSVKSFFIDKGINADRMTASGYGDTKPIGDNRTLSGRAVNRRVELVLK